MEKSIFEAIKNFLIKRIFFSQIAEWIMSGKKRQGGIKAFSLITIHHKNFPKKISRNEMKKIEIMCQQFP